MHLDQSDQCKIFSAEIPGASFLRRKRYNQNGAVTRQVFTSATQLTVSFFLCLRHIHTSLIGLLQTCPTLILRFDCSPKSLKHDLKSG